MCLTDSDNILHMSLQCYCGDLCAISLWFAEYIMNKGITKFDWILNSIRILWVGRAPDYEVTKNAPCMDLTSQKCYGVFYASFMEKNYIKCLSSDFSCTKVSETHLKIEHPNLGLADIQMSGSVSTTGQYPINCCQGSLLLRQINLSPSMDK